MNIYFLIQYIGGIINENKIVLRLIKLISVKIKLTILYLLFLFL